MILEMERIGRIIKNRIRFSAFRHGQRRSRVLCGTLELHLPVLMSKPATLEGTGEFSGWAAQLWREGLSVNPAAAAGEPVDGDVSLRDESYQWRFRRRGRRFPIRPSDLSVIETTTWRYACESDRAQIICERFASDWRRFLVLRAVSGNRVRSRAHVVKHHQKLISVVLPDRAWDEEPALTCFGVLGVILQDTIKVSPGSGGP